MIWPLAGLSLNVWLAWFAVSQFFMQWQSFGVCLSTMLHFILLSAVLFCGAGQVTRAHEIQAHLGGKDTAAVLSQVSVPATVCHYILYGISCLHYPERAYDA